MLLKSYLALSQNHKYARRQEDTPVDIFGWMNDLSRKKTELVPDIYLSIPEVKGPFTDDKFPIKECFRASAPPAICYANEAVKGVDDVISLSCDHMSLLAIPLIQHAANVQLLKFVANSRLINKTLAIGQFTGPFEENRYHLLEATEVTNFIAVGYQSSADLCVLVFGCGKIQIERRDTASSEKHVFEWPLPQKTKRV